MTELNPAKETFSGNVLGFAIPPRNVRGRMVRLDDVLDEILSAHDYPAPVTHLLAEALVVVALIGSLLKENGSQVTMQAQTEAGPISLLVCDYQGGAMRGYAQFDAERLAELGANPSLFALFGKGYLALTFDLPGDQGRYQGIVPLEGDTIAQACESYFVQSEQLPTLIKVAVSSSPEGCRAAGILVQHLPDGEEGRERLHARLDHPEWEHVAIMTGSIRHDELLDTELSLEALVWRVFHEEDEVRVSREGAITRGCRCSVEHYESVIGRFPAAEIDEMRDDDGVVVVDCAFCSKQFSLAA